MSIILITGGLGYIGSHTCINLMSNGYDVLVIDSLINSSKNNLLKIKDTVEALKKSNPGKIFFIEFLKISNTNIDIGFLNIAQILTIMSVIFGLIIFFKIKTNLFK